MRIINEDQEEDWAQNTALTGRGVESHTLAMRVEEVSKPRVELAFDAIGREFGEWGRMPDCIKSTRYVQRDGPDLMSDNEGLHHVLGELEQHVQGRVTWSESELLIWDEVVGEKKDFISTAMLDSMTMLRIRSKLIGL